ncbi:MAG: class I SAM-dependent methyltransferase [Thermodesulfobacteriota bacterium]
MPSVHLKPGREKSLLRRHPWVFSGAIDHVDGAPVPGDTVEIRSADGGPLGLGAFSPRSQITVRMWTFEPEEELSAGFFRNRLASAVETRRALALLEPRGACRLVNAESDGLPGLIVDRYAGFLVCQFLAAGVEHWKREIVVGLQDLLAPTGIYERSDAGIRAKEGLRPSSGVLLGSDPPDLVQIEEGPCRFAVDIRRGQKTGFYLDQRENRALLPNYAAGAEVLNCFAYTGAFGIWALKGGAKSILHVESSSDALGLARHHAQLNDLATDASEYRAGDVFQVLREYRDAGRRFDLIVLDPPKFVDTQAQLERGSRGYKDINLLAFSLLRPGGTLFTFSCSGRMPTDLFQKIVADAALDAGRNAQILRRLSQAADHPTSLAFPEGTYLKGLLVRVA